MRHAQPQPLQHTEHCCSPPLRLAASHRLQKGLTVPGVQLDLQAIDEALGQHVPVLDVIQQPGARPTGRHTVPTASAAALSVLACCWCCGRRQRQRQRRAAGKGGCRTTRGRVGGAAAASRRRGAAVTVSSSGRKQCVHSHTKQQQRRPTTAPLLLCRACAGWGYPGCCRVPRLRRRRSCLRGTPASRCAAGRARGCMRSAHARATPALRSATCCTASPPAAGAGGGTRQQRRSAAVRPGWRRRGLHPQGAACAHTPAAAAGEAAAAVACSSGSRAAPRATPHSSTHASHARALAAVLRAPTAAAPTAPVAALPGLQPRVAPGALQHAGRWLRGRRGALEPGQSAAGGVQHQPRRCGRGRRRAARRRRLGHVS